ncbi:MAG: hypothetical protein NTZ51_11210 [Proteobacteria bacterium]|nr:hypothetical protein [Pseudomonadota bacterium]
MDDFQVAYPDNKLWFIGLIIGLILCFLGNQIFLKSLFVFGFLALALPGYFIGSQAYGVPGGIVGLISCGIVGGILFIALYQAGLFVLGFLVGGALGLILTGGMLIPALLGIIAGLAFVALSGEFIIFGTALIGSYIVCESLFALILPGWIVSPGMSFAFKFFIFILGMLLQLGFHGK